MGHTSSSSSLPGYIPESVRAARREGYGEKVAQLTACTKEQLARAEIIIRGTSVLKDILLENSKCLSELPDLDPKTLSNRHKEMWFQDVLQMNRMLLGRCFDLAFGPTAFTIATNMVCWSRVGTLHGGKSPAKGESRVTLPSSVWSGSGHANDIVPTTARRSATTPY
ncbi:hypothetical protein QBC35DRAFT_462149 [Podospora australis]|uniref:Uncharacterized protein n=1 Tax=Podospora australis TaxID=1536484 RepID=A0AAN6WXE7_9PEZI|nr:hypothetical protein QBC35DRAFT_462149 [Podospora australis]